MRHIARLTAITAVTAALLLGSFTPALAAGTTDRPRREDSRSRDNSNRRDNKRDNGRKDDRKDDRNKSHNKGHNNGTPGRPGPTTPTRPNTPGRPVTPTRPSAPERPTHPGRPGTPGIRPPKPSSGRPDHRPWHRPTPRPDYRPNAGYRWFDDIFGLSRGISISVSLGRLAGLGFDILGYGNDDIYVRNIRQFNSLWPEAQYFYDRGMLVGAELYHSTGHHNTARYDKTYNVLVQLYGYPYSRDNHGRSRSATWFGPDGRFITLTYDKLRAPDGSNRWFTTVAIGY